MAVGSPNPVAKVIANAIRNDRGNSIVLAVTIIWTGLKLIRKLAMRQREVVYRTELAPGEGIRIRNLAVSQADVAAIADAE